MIGATSSPFSAPNTPHFTARAVKIARALDTTVEELIDGEDGRRYVLTWARNTGELFTPPDRIARLLKDIALLDDDGIRAVSILASGLGEGRR